MTTGNFLLYHVHVFIGQGYGQPPPAYQQGYGQPPPPVGYAMPAQPGYGQPPQGNAPKPFFFPYYLTLCQSVSIQYSNILRNILNKKKKLRIITAEIPALSVQKDICDIFLCPRFEKSGGVLFYRCPSVCPFVCLSAQT